jgi:ATP-dependent helicase/nuclease subunit A
VSTPTDYLVIKASAGSGKTYRVTEELVERLSRTRADDTPALRPDQIIATTFTRKAAAELSGRIREKLLEAGMLTQAAEVPAALVGTVNSVTGRILADFAPDAGRSPDLSVLSETAEKTAFHRATDDVVATAEDDNRALLTRTGYDLGPDEDPMYSSGRVNWAETVRSVINLARANDLGPEELAGFAEASVATLLATLDSADDSTGTAGTAGTATGDARQTVIETVHRIADELEAALADGVIKGRSVGPVEELLVGARAFEAEAAANSQVIRRMTWKAWFDAAVGVLPTATRKPSTPWEKAFTDAVPVTVFARDRQLREDLGALVRLVFTTATEAMRAYATYKDELGLIDFTDQEQLTLGLLREDSERGRLVRETLADRYRILVVDEFQDTSPLQLALFTELGRLVDEVIWVGDPKQSIYGFRGADPSLMSAALSEITAGGGRTAVLNHSWRTHEVPLDLTNRLFTRVFNGPDDEVRLSVPPQLAEEHAGGEVLVWPFSAPGRRNWLDPWFVRIARGLIDLEAAEGVPERGRAVLTRTNKQADRLRETLRAWGIPTEGGGTPLGETREGQLVRAACARLIDSHDTQALVELICLLTDHAAHSSWFDDLTAAARDDRGDLFRVWAQDATLAPLEELRPDLPELTVTETVVAVLDALDLRGRVASWEDPADRTGAVTGILQAVADYTADADSAGDPATLPGFLDHLLPDPDDRTAEAPTTQAPRDPSAVVVSTIHQAKGLEWDTVVVAPPRPADRFRAAGVWVEAPERLSLDSPLADRAIRFWPATVLAGGALKELFADTPEQLRRRAAEQLEEQRLLYVAMTRSRRRTVLAPHNSLADLAAFDGTALGLQEVTGVETADDGDGLPRTGLQITWPDGSEILDCPVPEVSQDADALRKLLEQRHAPARPTAAFIDNDRSPAPGPDKERIPATFAPSGVTASPATAAAASVTELDDLGEPLVTGGGPEWNLVGDCVHSYLAAPLDALDAETARQVAERLVGAWGVGGTVTPEQVVECGNRWTRWVTDRYPGATVASEVPFTWTNDAGQRAEGWLDQLLSTDRGRIIVDHKTYPGTDPVGHVKENYLGQMEVYRDALTAVDGVAPAAILIHLPLLGKVLEVTLG